VAHEQILSRFYPEALSEAKEAAPKARIKLALVEIKNAAGKLPLQAGLDIASAVMDIEGALAETGNDD